MKDKQIEKKVKEPIDKKDLLCYLGAVFFLIMAFLPMMMRFLDSDYGQEDPNVPEQPVVVNKLLCNKTVEEIGYSYDIEIVHTYKGGNVINSQFNYVININQSSNITVDSIIIPQYVDFSSVESKALTSSQKDSTYTVKIDYSKDEKISKNEIVKKHTKPIGVQRNEYELDKFSCIKQEEK